MGDCNRMKKHITDYLDHTLDPSTKKEFEQTLGDSKRLRKITEEVEQIKTSLGALQTYHCSENFNIRLREKILQNQKIPVNGPVRRYVLSLSFAAVLVLVMVIFNPFSSEDDGTSPQVPAASMQVLPEKKTPNIQNVTSTNDNESYSGRDIKTLDEAKAYADSTKEKSESPLKHVDQTEIQQTRP